MGMGLSVADAAPVGQHSEGVMDRNELMDAVDAQAGKLILRAFQSRTAMEEAAEGYHDARAALAVLLDARDAGETEGGDVAGELDDASLAFDRAEERFSRMIADHFAEPDAAARLSAALAKVRETLEARLEATGAALRPAA